MTRFTTRPLRPLLALTFLASTVVGAVTQAGAIDITPRVRELRNAHRLPALAAALIERGEISAIGAYGVRTMGQSERVTLDDAFHLGSCTKAFTATLAAILVQQGLIGWDTTIGEALPEIAEAIHPQYRAVTLDQLLRHRGGLPDDRQPNPVLWLTLRQLPGDDHAARVTAARLALAQNPAVEPGVRVIYSNLGYTVVGAMLEAVAGDTWENLIRVRIFEPLGMTTAGFGPPGVADANIGPSGHRIEGGRPHPVAPGPGADNPAVIAPAGLIHCSIRDWAKFVAEHLAGATGGDPKLLPASVYKELHTAPRKQQDALGWLAVPRPWAGGLALTHAGTNGLWYALVWVAPKRDMALLVVTNVGGDEAAQACDRVITTLIFDPPKDESAD